MPYRQELARRGEAIVVIDDFSSGSRDNLSSLDMVPTVVVEDLRGPLTAGRSLEGAEKVFHVTAEIGNVASLAVKRAIRAAEQPGD